MKNSIFFLGVCVVLWFAIGDILYAQSVIYSNPLQENERNNKNNPFFLVGFLSNNILIGKVNEHGFYISVYNNKMSMQNNVYYKELDLRYFEVMDMVNFNDVGLLFVQRKAVGGMPAILYGITFSDTGVPIKEAQTLDTLPLGWGSEVFHKVLVSDNRQYIFVGRWNNRLREHNFRGILLNVDGQVVRKMDFTLNMGATEWGLTDVQMDNQGNVFLLTESTQDEWLQEIQLYTLRSQDGVVTNQKFSVDGRRIKDIKMGIDNLFQRLFFYGLYNGAGRMDYGGLYGVWMDIGKEGFYAEHFWKMNELAPDLKPAQVRNLELKSLIFLKNKGFVASCEIRYIIQNGGSLLMPSFVTPSIIGSTLGKVSGGFSLGTGLSSFGNASPTEYYAENAYVFEMDGEGNIGAKHTLYKNQMQRDAATYIGYNIFNTGNQLNFIYNDFQATGDMSLVAYVLDPKHHFVKKALSLGQDQHFALVLGEGRQIAPFAYLAPYVFKEEWRGFALIVL